jgi:hypothetical protein
MAALRSGITTGADYSLHTNGVLLLRQPVETALYDKVCLSFPSFEPATYGAMMGPPRPPDLAGIARVLGRRLKVSCLVSRENEHELESFLPRCRDVGVPRLVLRRLLGDERPFPPLDFGRLTGTYRGCPVYDYDGMEITLWHFERTESTSLNLFADGTLGRSYLLTRTAGFAESAPAAGADGDFIPEESPPRGTRRRWRELSLRADSSP